MAASLSITLANRRHEIARAAELIETFGHDQAVAEDDLAGVNLALDEVLANIITHAYEDDAEHTIHVRIVLDDTAILVSIEDDGRPFNPLSWPPPNLDVPLDQRNVGGLGLYIARSVVESIEYRRENGKNILTLRKRLATG